MEDLNKKISELEKENIALRERLIISERSRNPLGNVPIPTKKQENQLLQENSITSQFLNYLKTILGYNIEQVENRFILRSVYAFCDEDVFEIEISNNKLIFKSTDYLSEHQDLFNVYVKNGKSYCAFFAAVTIELFNKKTFG